MVRKTKSPVDSKTTASLESPRRKSEKGKNKTPAAALHTPCRVWWAYKKPNGIKLWEEEPDGLLVTEPDNLLAPVAFVPIIDGDVRQAVVWVQYVLANPDKLTLSSVPADDLRESCRWWSKDRTPDYLFALRVLAAEGALAKHQWQPMDLNPFCPIRLAEQVEIFVKLRWPDASREELPYNLVGAIEFQADDSDNCHGDCQDAVIRRIDHYPHDWPNATMKMLEASKLLGVAPSKAALIPPHNRSMSEGRAAQ